MGYRIDTVNIAPEAKKCVLVFAPHTSLSDFIIGWMALKDMGVKTAFVMKKEAFFFPIKYIFKAMGGVPVDRQHGAHFPEFAAELIKNSDEIAFLISPEGTRKRVDKWKKGFLQDCPIGRSTLVVGLFGLSQQTWWCRTCHLPFRRLRERLGNNPTLLLRYAWLEKR